MRELPNGTPVKRTAKGFDCELEPMTLTDVWSDARFYAHEYGPDMSPAFKRSAKLTAERCAEAAGMTWQEYKASDIYVEMNY